jgi:hypothetical protein
MRPLSVLEEDDEMRVSSGGSMLARIRSTLAGGGSAGGIGGSSSRLPATVKKGPSMRSVGSKHYLDEEIGAAREAVQSLDRAVSAAQSYRERASRLLEESHRALSRLEQVG